MKYLIRLYLLITPFLLFSKKGTAQSGTVVPNCPFHLIIAVDFSGSESEFLDELQTALVALTDKFELDSENMKIGLISFNRGAQLLHPLSGDNFNLRQTINNLRIPTRVYATDIHWGIALAEEQFRKNSKPGIPKYFVLISDGDPHAHARGRGYQYDLINADKLKSFSYNGIKDPVHIFSLYTGRTEPFLSPYEEVIREASIDHMRKIASDARSFYFFEELGSLVRFFEEVGICL